LIDKGKKANNLFNLMRGGTKWIRRLEPHNKNLNPGEKESPGVEERQAARKVERTSG
jgi:hypothetical protein